MRILSVPSIFARLLYACSLGAVSTLHGAGEVTVLTRGWVGTELVASPVCDLDGVTKLEGETFAAQYYVAPAAGGAFTAWGSPQPFRTGNSAGYLVPTTLTVPFVAPGSLVRLQLRAWDAAAGPSFEAALAAEGKVGCSLPFTSRTSIDTEPPSVPPTAVVPKGFALKFGPQLVAPAAVGLAEGQPWNALLELSRGGPVQWRVASGSTPPAGLTLDPATGAIAWVPSEDQGPGGFSFRVEACDLEMPELAAQAAVTLVVAEVNAAPIFGGPVEQECVEQQALSLRLHAVDPDVPSNALRYELLQGPAGAAMDAASGLVTWLPSEMDGPGDVTLLVRALDDGAPAMAVTNTVRLHVKEANQAPRLALPSTVVEAREGQQLTLALQGADADLPANHLRFSLESGAPAGVVLDPAGELRWTPAEEQGPGTYTLQVRLEDDGTPALAELKSLQIVVAEENAAPTLALPAELSVSEDTALDVVLAGLDSDRPENRLSYAATGLPDGATFDTSTGRLRWTPREGQQGHYAVTVQVTDDASKPLSASQVVQITAVAVNDAPTISAIARQKIREGEASAEIQLELADPDTAGELLEVSVVSSDPALVPQGGIQLGGSGTNRTLVLTPAPGQHGVAVISVEVRDGELSASTSFELEVQQVLSLAGVGHDGYIAGGTVFLDVNGNGLLDAGEPSAVTDAAGKYQLKVALAELDTNGNGQLDPEEGTLQLQGGRDIATGRALDVPLRAPITATVINPLTTLVSAVMDVSRDNASGAADQVKQALGLPVTVDLTSYDPIQAVQSGDSNAVRVLAAAATVQDTLVQVASVVGGSEPAGSVSAAAGSASAGLAGTVAAGRALDLGNPASVARLIESTAVAEGTVVPVEVAAGAAVLIAELNERKQEVAASGASPMVAAAQLVQVQVVAQGETADRLAQAAAGDASMDALMVSHTGSALNQLVSTAPVGDILGSEVRPGTFQFTRSENSLTEAGASAVPVVVGRYDGNSGEVSVRVTARDGTATIAGGDLHAWSQVITFAAGEITRAVDLTGLVVDDAAKESAETFSLELSLEPGAPVGAVVGTAKTISMQLVDNESAGVFAFTVSQFQMREDGTAIVPVSVTRTGGSSGEVRLRITPASTGPSVVAGADFASDAVDVVFGDGVMVRTVAVPVMADGMHEGTESIALELVKVSGPVEAALGAMRGATLLVQDDDAPAAPRVATRPVLQAGACRFEVSADPGATLQVDVATDLNGGWTPLGTAQADALGRVVVNDPAPGQGARVRFYRVRQQ